VYGSLYPLAEWVAAGWWLIASHLRPSAVETRYWSWPNIQAYPWLAQHNLRGADDGMAWPNLTLVPEGNGTRAVWAPDACPGLGGIRFVSVGDAWLSSEDLSEGMAAFVDHVLERLTEEGLPKTRLAEEWSAVGRGDEEEREFCRTAARLGLDPYSVSDEQAAEIIEIATGLPPELVGDFFDSANPQELPEAAEWTRRALRAADRAAAKATRTLQPLYDAAARAEADARAAAYPWSRGYAMARQVRSMLQVPAVQRFDISPWVGTTVASTSSAGIQGVAAVHDDRCGLVAGDSRLNQFRQARALGRSLLNPEQRSFVLSAARGYEERVARAFAAELLAPAEGIRQVLAGFGRHYDAALEAVAQRFHVSPLVVRHQYDDQLTRVAGETGW